MNTGGDGNDIELSKIKPIIPNDVFKVIKEELSNLIIKIASDNHLDKKKILNDYADDISKIGVKMGIKRRNRRSLPQDLQCVGRKIDGQQCTRSKRTGSDFCLSHIKRLPHGRIDDPEYQEKEKGKRGRKKKESDYNSDEYIATHLEIIDGVQYLIDTDSNVYSYNIESPELIGKKGLDGELIKA
jgi:hypothetical protein